MEEEAPVRRRPRSTIIPGRNTFTRVILTQAGEADEDSFRDRDTESDNSVGNRSATGQDAFRVNRADLVANQNISFDFRDASVHEDEADADVTEEEEEEQVPVAKKKKIVEESDEGMILEKQPFYRATGDSSPTGRPSRNRCPPVRWWLGEEPVYKWQTSGCGELQGVTDVVVLDKLYMKYKTASPVTMIHLIKAEHKKRWGRTTRKRARV